jgi:hypothetical protein
MVSRKNKIPKIEKSKRTCKYCKAYTSANKPCKRLASCKIGCKNFCTQHAEALGGKVKRKNSRPYKCKQPFIEDCYLDTTEFPCKKKLTYFWSKRSWNSYIKSKKSGKIPKSQKRSKRSIIKDYNVKHPSIYVTRSRKVKFEN